VSGRTAQAFVVAACFALPWLNPRAAGPSASVEPWLVSALCGAIAFGLLRPAFPRGWGVALLAALPAWALLRSGLSPETVAFAAAALLVFMAWAIAADRERCPDIVRWVVAAWLVAAVVSTAIALVQYFGWAEMFSPWTSVSAIGEPFANLRQRNQFASLTAIGMACLFWLAPGRIKPAAAFALMAWLAIGNAATTSRTGLAELLVLGALAALWPGDRRLRLRLWLAGLAAYAVAAICLPWLLEAATGTVVHRLWDRVASVDNCSSRAVLWTNVVHLIAEKPWAGWGWGELDYAHYANLYSGARFCDILDNAHNLPLHLAVELGLPAALAACGVAAWLVVRARPWREADPARQLAWAVLALLALHSLLEYPLWYGPFQVAAGLCLGLLAPRHAGDLPSNRGSGVLAPALAAVAIASCVYALWDYRRVSQVYLPAEARAPAYREDPLPQARGTWLFRNQSRFAEVTLTDLTLANQAWMYENSLALLHYSPEPRIIEKVVESGTLTGRTDEAVLHLARLRAAFPDAYAAWQKAKR
jgi:O-antigen ligase